MVYNKTRGIHEPLIDRYNRFYEKFIHDDNEQKGLPPDQKKAAHRKKIFGESYDLISNTPDEYSILATALSMGSYYDWRELNIYEQAQLIAHKRITNMIETLERHIEINKQNIEDLNRNKGKNKGK